MGTYGMQNSGKKNDTPGPERGNRIFYETRKGEQRGGRWGVGEAQVGGEYGIMSDVFGKKARKSF